MTKSQKIKIKNQKGRKLDTVSPKTLGKSSKFDPKLIKSIVIGNIIGLIFAFILSFTTVFGYIALTISLLTATIAGAIAGGNKKIGIIAGLFSIILVLILFLFVSPKNVIILISIVLMGLFGGLVGNYFGPKSKNLVLMILFILLIILIITVFVYSILNPANPGVTLH